MDIFDFIENDHKKVKEAEEGEPSEKLKEDCNKYGREFSKREEK